ncbi:hypothetical protein DFJ43DRAFT_1167183, partial [Lentinula guzmanii]
TCSHRPYHWAKLPSTSIRVDPQTGNRTLARSLTDHYLRAANINVFKPRGLVARICTTSAMLILTTKPEKLDDTTPYAYHRSHRPSGIQILRERQQKRRGYLPTDWTAEVGFNRMVVRYRFRHGSPPYETQVVMQTMSRYGVHLSGTRAENRKGEQWSVLKRLRSWMETVIKLIILLGRVLGLERAEKRRRQIGGQDRLLWFVIMPAEKDMEIEDASWRRVTRMRKMSPKRSGWER